MKRLLSCSRCWPHTLRARPTGAPSPGGPPSSTRSLKRPRESSNGELSLYVLDVESGEAYAYDADTPTYLSSAIKIAVMLEVLHQVDLQQLSWDEELEFGPEAIRDGMHRLGEARPGERLSIATLLEYMMGDSDNAAADLLIRRVGVDNVRAQLAARGSRAWAGSSRPPSRNESKSSLGLFMPAPGRLDRRHALSQP